MATFSKLPSGRWRVQIRRGDIYRAATFDKKGDARDWATQIEAQAEHIQKGGLISPKGLKVGHLVEMYREAVPGGGRTKGACLARLEDRLKRTAPDRLAFALRDFIDKRQAEGAGGVTIAQDLSYLSTVLDWARHTRRIEVDPEVARDARCCLSHSTDVTVPESSGANRLWTLVGMWNTSAPGIQNSGRTHGEQI